MGTIHYTLKVGTKPTPEQIAEIKAAVRRPIVYTEDAPKLSPEELAEFRRVCPEKSKQAEAL